MQSPRNIEIKSHEWASKDEHNAQQPFHDHRWKRLSGWRGPSNMTRTAGSAELTPGHKMPCFTAYYGTSAAECLVLSGFWAHYVEKALFCKVLGSLFGPPSLRPSRNFIISHLGKLHASLTTSGEHWSSSAAQDASRHK
eukprot:4843791-Amphidinium_carterae.1